MSEAVRIDRLTQPAVVGQFYLVPTVQARWHWQYADWPVIGPRHSDVEFLDFKWQHFHIDPRFVDEPLFDEAVKYGRGVADFFVRPISNAQAVTDELTEPLPNPVWRPLRMQRAMPFYPADFSQVKPLRALWSHFAGRQCERGKSGWICPHRRAALGSLAPVDGVVTCPLHGLRIHATTGVVESAPGSAP